MINQYEPAEPEEQKFTHWHNPTDDTVKIDAFVGPGVVKSPTNRVRYTWKPGETKAIPAEFDAAIHQLDSRDTIIGGLAPQLRRSEAPDQAIVPALDVAEQGRKQALKDAETAVIAKKAAEQALVVAVANMDVAREVKDSKAIAGAKADIAAAQAKADATKAIEVQKRDAIPPPSFSEEKLPPKGRM